MWLLLEIPLDENPVSRALPARNSLSDTSSVTTTEDYNFQVRCHGCLRCLLEAAE
jgi:hypothetical protein